MTTKAVRLALLIITAGLLSACGEGTSIVTSTSTVSQCPVVVADAGCDKSQRPFVFVHGTFGSGDNFAHVAALLGSNGVCQDRIVAVEYNSLGDQPGSNGAIDAAIDKVLAANPGFTQVDLAGHSQGTMHCGIYLRDPAHAAKVAHYINFSGVPNVGAVETLSLSSQGDLGGSPHHASGTHVTKVTFTDEDHFAVAASTRSFVELYKYLRGTAPKYTDVQCGADPVTIEGIAETFANNVPVTGRIELHELGRTPRQPGTAVTVGMPDADGHFGPIQVKRNVAYEFTGYDADGKLVGYSYFTPFKRSNRLVRLLTPSNDPLIAGQSTDHVVRGPHHAAIVARWSGGAFRQDLGASLAIDGMEVLTSENAGTAALATRALNGGVVGLFMYDDDLNAQTDLGLVYSTSFIAFTDVFLPATTPKFIDLTFVPGSEDGANTGTTARIANWPSSDALISVMFQ